MRRKQKWMLIIGIAAMLVGLGVLGAFGVTRLQHELYLRRLLRENIVFSIPALEIRVPVLEGTDNETLSVAAGHFPDTGALGEGNYCIAGHNSTIYACIFNDLDQIELGMELLLYDLQRNCYRYVVTDYQIVAPTDTWILEETEDAQITVITCTDDGTQRQVVIGSFQGMTENNER